MRGMCQEAALLSRILQGRFLEMHTLCLELMQIRMSLCINEIHRKPLS